MLVKKAKKSKKWKPFFFALFGAKNRLYYFENAQAIKPKGIIDLGGTALFHVDDSFFGR